MSSLQVGARNARGTEGCADGPFSAQIEAGIIPAMPVDADPDLSKVSDAELADYVIGAFRTIREALPYIRELRQRFAQLPRGHAGIAGCASWKGFCEDRLHRTPSAIRKALAGERNVTEPKAPTAPTNAEKLFEARILAAARPLARYVSAKTSTDTIPRQFSENRRFRLTTTFYTERELNEFIGRVRSTYPPDASVPDVKPERQKLLRRVTEELYTPDPCTRRTRFERFVRQLAKTLQVTEIDVIDVASPAQAAGKSMAAGA
jgi:hypothetical protein